MGRFNPDNYDFNSDYAKSIAAARADLEQDYPNSYVVIGFRCGNKGRADFEEVRLAPPDGHDQVIWGRFEIPRHLFGSTYGYVYVVFSEGTLQYSGSLGGDWITKSDGAIETDGPGKGVKTWTWKRKDGSSVYRTVTNIDPANWMRDLSDDLFLSQLTIPGTHNSHALVGTIQLPHQEAKDLGDVLLRPWDEATNLFGRARTLAECQDIDIPTQLERGVRYLDLRYGKELRMRHGQVGLPGTLRDCVDAVARFLDAHPSETVIVVAKWDVNTYITDERQPEPPEVRAAANQVFIDQPRFLDVPHTPRLGECRGRIIRKREGGGADHGLKFSGRPYRPEWSQPEFHGLSGDERMQRIRRSWERNKAAIAWVKHVRPLANVSEAWDNTGFNDYHADAMSVATLSSIPPVDFSAYSNKELLRWVQKECGGPQKYELGIVQVDFAGMYGDLLTQLILTNFA